MNSLIVDGHVLPLPDADPVLVRSSGDERPASIRLVVLRQRSDKERQGELGDEQSREEEL